MPAVDSGRARAIASAEFFSFLAPAEYSTIIDHYDVENTAGNTTLLRFCLANKRAIATHKRPSFELKLHRNA